MALRTVFFGTPAFAAVSLERLQASAHQIAVVVTQPDRPRGRGHHVVPSAVKVRATQYGLPVLQPARLERATLESALQAHAPDLAVVAAYGKLLPSWLIELPRLGTINVHASLLPRWRGAAPIHRAILAGDEETGITIMRIVQALDAGPMISQARLAIGPTETSAELEARLAAAGAAALLDVLDRLAAGPVAETGQDERRVTYAPRLERRESQIGWNRPAAEVHNQIRGLQPWPLASGLLRGQRLILLGSSVEPALDGERTPGEIALVERDAVVVAAGAGGVRVTRVQPEGRPPMSVRDYLNGRRVTPGDRFEPLP